MSMQKNSSVGNAGLTIYRIFCYFVLILLSVLSLAAFYILIINTTRAHPDIAKGFSLLPGKSFLVNMKSVFSNDTLPVLTGIFNSFIVSAGVAALATYFSAMTAYGIHAYTFKFKNAIFAFILMIMIVPTQVSALGFVSMIRDMDLLNSFIPLIIPAIASPIIFFFMKQYMESALPLEIIEAARIDGSNEFYTFNRIVFPILKPAIAVQAIFAFTGAWNNYFIPALILDKKDMKTLPILIAMLRSADFAKFDLGQVYGLIFVSIIPVALVYLFLSKYIVRGIALGSVKG